ncbi:hypothetical protein AVEN_90968-1 [Araneus ventricosus]|uniref:Uncharacterized protein n=1 Tax=Araneus ventricosus TaxID=182803 RepID=A0A4Y2LRR7_ARAVE|nr:hypothetical protein AVEN_90968-1 [Araneus ventricosus]
MIGISGAVLVAPLALPVTEPIRRRCSRFVSGHLRSCSFSHGNKVFPVCAKCGVASASPEHILSCLRLSRETFETDPLLALDFLRVSGLMDGV